MPGLRLLLVDDNRDFLDLIERILREDARLEIVAMAMSGRHALELASQHKPDVVLIDLAMPEMNGLQTTRHLKAADEPPCVVIMTGHTNKEYQIAASIAGADAFISKDDFYLHFNQLIEWLHRHRSQPPDGLLPGP
jgi:DNA-binding NarL/FixJ family response regulator